MFVYKNVTNLPQLPKIIENIKKYSKPYVYFEV